MSPLSSRVLGIAAIVVGVLVALRMLWLVPPLLLIGGGVLYYRYQKIVGRTDLAVYGVLWGVGLGLAMLTKLFFPALLVLAGLTVLLRGREARVDGQLRARWQALGLSRHVATIATVITRSDNQAGKR